MKKTPFYILLILLIVSGCRRDNQVINVLEDAREFTDEFVHEVLSDSSFNEGVQAGHKYLDKHDKKMRKKWKSLEDYNQVQVTSSTLEALEDFVFFSRREMARIRMHYADEVHESHKNEETLNRLIDRYYEVLDH